jgi:hypothetical protein
MAAALRFYKNFVVRDPLVVDKLETFLRSLSYLIPGLSFWLLYLNAGRFSNSEEFSEIGNLTIAACA